MPKLPSLIDFLALATPPVIGGILHMFAVRYDWLPALKKPVSQRLFGANKTWRGFVVMPLFTILGMFVVSTLLGTGTEGGEDALSTIYRRSPPVSILFTNLVLGAAIGFAYVLGELPNSYLKRRVGIPPGEQATGTNATLFFLLDRTDFAFGIVAVYLLWGVNPALAPWLIPLGIGVHLAVTVPLYFAGVKEKIL